MTIGHLSVSNITLLLLFWAWCVSLVRELGASFENPPPRQPERCRFHRKADQKELLTRLGLGICNRERLQLPTPSAASSMRRSQSAVEATADYLGTRVVPVTYLNPDGENRYIFIFIYLQRLTEVNAKGNSVSGWQKRACRAVPCCAVSLFVPRDTYGLKGGFRSS